MQHQTAKDQGMRFYITLARTRQGLSQNKIALRMGISGSALSNAKAGVCNLSNEKWLILAKLAGVQDERIIYRASAMYANSEQMRKFWIKQEHRLGAMEVKFLTSIAQGS